MRRHALVLLLGFLLVSRARLAVAQDWPQFRGPDGQGHSDVRGLPVDWSESTNVVWKVRVPGRGWSSPVVAGQRVWLTTATTAGRREASLRLLSHDVATGNQILDVEVFRLRSSGLLNSKNSHASPHRRGRPGLCPLRRGGHGSALDDWREFDGAFVIALDKYTGKTRWRTFRRQPWSQAYSTPLAIRVADRDQIVSVGAHRASAYEPESGKEIWRVSYPGGFSNVPRPVYGHGLVFITTGFQQPSILAMRTDGSGDVTRTHVAWTLSRGAL